MQVLYIGWQIAELQVIPAQDELVQLIVINFNSGSTVPAVRFAFVPIRDIFPL